jgi:hypothetical protein
MNKRVSIFAVIAFAGASNVLAAPHSIAAFKKLQALAGEWVGTDDKHQPVKTNFNSIVSNTAVMETLSGHQHHLVIRFEDEDHITEIWTWRHDGMDMPMVFHLTRKAK